MTPFLLGLVGERQHLLPGRLHRAAGPRKLLLGAHENADFLRPRAAFDHRSQPVADEGDLLLLPGEGADGGLGTVEYRDRAGAAVLVTVDVADLTRQQHVGAPPDLM